MLCPLTVVVPNTPSSPAVDVSCVVRVVSRVCPSEWLRSHFRFGFSDADRWDRERSDGKLCVDCFALV